MDAKDGHGDTPLHEACYCGQAEVVKALLEKGADLHAKDSHGYTLLIWACGARHGIAIAAML